MHETVSGITRRYRRSLQARANKETAAERTMREYFESQSLQGMFLDSAGDDFDIRPMRVPSSANGGEGPTSSTGLSTRAARVLGGPISGAGATATPVPGRLDRATAAAIRNFSSTVDNDIILVPESDDEDWSTDLEESSMSYADEPADTGRFEHHTHVITRMMYEEAISRAERESGGRTRHFATLQPKPAKSILDRVRETDDPSPMTFNGSKSVNSPDEAGKPASEGSSKFKMADDVPPNFRWVEIEIK